MLQALVLPNMLMAGDACVMIKGNYPVLLNDDKDFANKNHIFNNVVCSGAHYDDVEEDQFYDEDTCQ